MWQVVGALPDYQRKHGTKILFNHVLFNSDLEQEEAVESKIIVYADNQLDWKVSDHKPVAALFKADLGLWVGRSSFAGRGAAEGLLWE